MGRGALIGAGVLFLVIGFGQLVVSSGTGVLLDLGIWLAAGVLLHDLVIAGIVAVSGWLLSRALPIGVRAYAQLGLAVAGAVAVMSIPVLVGAGRKASNPSVLPQDYPRNLAIVLVAVFLISLLLAVLDRGGGLRRRD